MTSMSEEHRGTIKRQVYTALAGAPTNHDDLRFYYQFMGQVIERDLLGQGDGPDRSLHPRP